MDNANSNPYFYPNTIDAHVHVFNCGIEGIEKLLAVQKRFGYEASNLLSCECMEDAAQNALGIYFKLTAPGNFAFGGFHYRYPYPHSEEAAGLIEIGFDGIKLIENKPTLRKKLGIAFNDPRYDEFYKWMEKERIPMIVHVADPEEFWDANLIPPWAKEAGYFYGDGTFVAKETIYNEVFDVMDRYPNLTVIFAHFLFLSGDIERLDRLMEKYPNMGLDIVSGTEMYFNFTGYPEQAREFFIKYSDRIMFGTDNYNIYDMTELNNAIIVNNFEHEFIRTDHVIPAWDRQITGIALPIDIQEKIFRTNFLKLVGGKPRQINLKAAVSYLGNRLNDDRMQLTEREYEIITHVYDYCRLKAADIADFA